MAQRLPIRVTKGSYRTLFSSHRSIRCVVLVNFLRGFTRACIPFTMSFMDEVMPVKIYKANTTFMSEFIFNQYHCRNNFVPNCNVWNLTSHLNFLWLVNLFRIMHIDVFHFKILGIRGCLSHTFSNPMHTIVVVYLLDINKFKALQGCGLLICVNKLVLDHRWERLAMFFLYQWGWLNNSNTFFNSSK